MAWNVVFLIGGITTLVLGIYSFTQRKRLFLSIIGVVWFLIVLFKLFIPNVYGFVLIQGIPVLGDILLFLVLPALLVLAFFQHRLR